MVKLTIVGYGNVGKAISLLLLGSSHEFHLNILDPAEDKSGIFLDFQHAFMAQENKKLSINEKDLLAKSDYIFFTAGVLNTAGGSRLDKVEENKVVAHQVFANCILKSDVKIIVITNPVDVLTLEILKITGLPWSQVIGTGTFLDSLRFQYHLSKEAGVNSDNLEAVILGEHGSSQVPMISLSTFESSPISMFPMFTEKVIEKAAEATRNSAAEIRKTESGTSIGVAQCAVKIIEYLQSESEVIIPLSVKVDDIYKERFNLKKDLCISVPVSISRKGVLILPIPNFTAVEEEAFKKSIKALLPYV